jgi:hypothetical protein
LSVRTAAERVGWNATGVSTIEMAERSPSVEDVAALLTVYGVVDERRRVIVDMVKSLGDKACWWAGVSGSEPEVALSFHERCAGRITEWAPVFVPALLQTGGYAGAFAALGGGVVDGVARAERLKAVRRVPYVGFLGEEALRAPVGGAAVHRGQLRHLIDVSRRGMVRVVRRRIPHAGLRGAWTALQYADGEVVRVDLLGSAVYLTGVAARPYGEAQSRLADVALSPEHSCALIEAMVERPMLVS